MSRDNIKIRSPLPVLDQLRSILFQIESGKPTVTDDDYKKAVDPKKGPFGVHQFIGPGLANAGWIERASQFLDATDWKWTKAATEYKVYSIDDFLNNPEAQEAAFEAQINRKYNLLNKKEKDTDAQGVIDKLFGDKIELTLIGHDREVIRYNKRGLKFALNLISVAGAKELIFDNIDSYDTNGMLVSYYLAALSVDDNGQPLNPRFFSSIVNGQLPILSVDKKREYRASTGILAFEVVSGSIKNPGKIPLPAPFTSPTLTSQDKSQEKKEKQSSNSGFSLDGLSGLGNFFKNSGSVSWLMAAIALAFGGEFLGKKVSESKMPMSQKAGGMLGGLIAAAAAVIGTRGVLAIARGDKDNDKQNTSHSNSRLDGIGSSWQNPTLLGSADSFRDYHSLVDTQLSTSLADAGVSNQAVISAPHAPLELIQHKELHSSHEV